MSETLQKIKCVHCDSDDTFVFLANADPRKIAFRCRKCTTSWRNIP